ncbi:putative cytochrome P450 28d1 [Ptiloglossa arizonensis]|uniref:putative cytochrome P450 28d1 n=1 Tax=Ptiloglossa arizonensis TaxID=3350558 RepID=UPI003F9F37C0
MTNVCLTLVVGAVALLVLYFVQKYTYWKRRGIPTAKGLVPFVGHIWPLISLKLNMANLARKLYEDAKNHSMIGWYQGTCPSLIVREPQLVKTVLLSNFSNFHENAMKLDLNVDRLLAKNPFFSYGEIWMAGRKRLTWAFSSMRLKILFVSVNGVCKKFVDFVDRKLKSSNKYEVELKSLFSRFTGEVVANAGLGIEGFCFEDETRPGSFVEMGNALFEPTLKKAIAHTLMFFVPGFNKLFTLPFVPKRVDRFMRQVIAENLEIRRKASTPRNDFLQLMIDFEKTEGEKLDEEALASHAFSFFGDGYETSSITMSFIGYQLAKHPDIQEKLREEITSTIAKHDGELTFEALKEMTYMDQVINESQRCYPAAGFVSKLCTEECELQGTDGLRCRVKPGTLIIVPIHALHLDPEYWIDPEIFDPERFNDDRKQSIEKMTFLPFGEGPRMCVGMRMALLQIKACVATLLRNYKLELSPKTQTPLQLSPYYFMTAAVGGVWVYISKI